MKRFKSMPRQSKCKIFVKAVIILLCLLGLIAFSSVLLEQFATGKTVVNIKYEILDYNKIPGITICFFHGLSLDKLMDHYPEKLKRLWKRFEQDPQNFTDSSRDNETNWADKYSSYVYSPFRWKFNGTVQELFNLSIPFSEINARGYAFTAQGICSAFNDSFYECKFQDNDPIESMAFGGVVKCFTFFSHLNPKWRNVSMHVDNFGTIIQFNDKWYPDYYNTYFTEAIRLSMHTPDELPQYNVNNFIKLNIGHINTIRYSRIKMKLLGHKYDTNCRNYSIENPKPEKRMRSNCAKYCVKIELDRENSRSNMLYQTKDLWTKSEIEQFKDHKVCHNFVKNDKDCYPDQKLLKNCEESCHMKCINRYYNYDNHEDKLYGNYYKIDLVHNQLPDQITEHMPETTPIEFISNFGGLLGMWLGLSVLAILKFTLQLMHRIKRLDSVKDI